MWTASITWMKTLIQTNWFYFQQKKYKLAHLLVKFYQLNNKVFKLSTKINSSILLGSHANWDKWKILSRNKFVILICLKQKNSCHICKMIWFVKHLITNRITSDSYCWTNALIDLSKTSFWAFAPIQKRESNFGTFTAVIKTNHVTYFFNDVPQSK